MQLCSMKSDTRLALMSDQVGAGQLIVYEVPLRTFTAHPNSNVGSGKQGTFLGFLDKVSSSCILLQMTRTEEVHQQPVKLCRGQLRPASE